jgi:uncharacterized MAPEG superfamily protein
VTIELTYLAWTAVLCILLWFPYIAAGASQHGFLTPADYKIPGSRVLPEWANRAQRAHLNLLENLPSFAVLILIAHLTDTSTETTAIAAATFFWARIVQTVVHITGVPYVRTAAFFVGMVAQLTIASEILFK